MIFQKVFQCKPIMICESIFLVRESKRLLLVVLAVRNELLGHLLASRPGLAEDLVP